jgi:hypothetical protein
MHPILETQLSQQRSTPLLLLVHGHEHDDDDNDESKEYLKSF